MPDLEAVLASLDRIDWNFPRSGTASRSVHTTHWFPGNFIAQIPAALVQILSDPEDLVFDPFAGSGTTGIEASRLRRRSIVSDRLSSCVLIMNGKIAAGRGALAPSSAQRLIEKLTWEHECLSTAVGLRGEGSAAELQKWFSPQTLAQLRYLWKLAEAERGGLRDVMTLLFSDVLFACASSGGAITSSGGRRRHHWGWVADNVLPKFLLDHNAIAAFRDRVHALAGLDHDLQEAFLPQVIRQDSRSCAINNEAVDLVVTSPPYVGVIDYTHANRLLYLWMNWPMSDERESEIGARYKRKRRALVEEYLSDMDRTWSEVDRVLKPGGYCAIVIGESRKFPGTISKTADALQTRLPLVWGPFARKPSRRRVSDRDASEPVEEIMVFRKPC